MKQPAGIVLAAGASSRMGGPKALLDAGGATFTARLVTTLREGGCGPVVVVAASEAGEVAAEVGRCGARLVVNPGGEGGQIGSLRAALEYLCGLDDPLPAFVFSPVDNPAVTPETVRGLIAGWRGSGAPIVMPRYEEERGHPVLADMTIAHEFQARDLEEGARGVVRRDPGRVLEVPVADAGVVDDIDTPRRYRERFGGGGRPGRRDPAAGQPRPRGVGPDASESRRAAAPRVEPRQR